MRKATFAKLGLTAAVGLGTLLGQPTIAQAETPPANGGVKVIAQPTTTTTMKPLKANPVDPKPCGQIDCIEAVPVDPDPPAGPDLPITQPEGDDCDQPSCDKAPPPKPGPKPECHPQVLCDEFDSDPGCTWTHGCPEDPKPECPDFVICDEITSDPGCNVTHGSCDDGGEDGGTDDGGEDGGTDDGGDDDGTDGDEGTDGEDGTTGGGTGGGTLPRTGAEMATWAVAGLGLTGVGAALRKLGRRSA